VSNAARWGVCGACGQGPTWVSEDDGLCTEPPCCHFVLRAAVPANTDRPSDPVQTELPTAAFVTVMDRSSEPEVVQVSPGVVRIRTTQGQGRKA